MALVPREVPPESRFVLGIFRDVAHAEETLATAVTLAEVNKAVLRSCGIILDSPHYASDEVDAYARSVMDDQTVTLRDIEDIKAIIEEMKDIEKLMGS